jgi:hypothetical protein
MASDDPNREAHKASGGAARWPWAVPMLCGLERRDMGTRQMKRSSMGTLSEAKRGRFSRYPGARLTGNFETESPRCNATSATYSDDRRLGLAISRRAQTRAEDVR